MALTLVGDPGSGNVVQHPSGLVVLRAADYIGPGRSTLSTVTDASSLAGMVVREQQALAVPTTLAAAGNSQRWPLASDTLRIPKATLQGYLDLANEDRFVVMITTKTLGDPPSNARYKKSHLFFNQLAGGAAAGMAWGRDTTLIDPFVMTRTSVWGDQYKINYSLVFWSQLSSGTNLVLRAWGVTDGTLEYELDLVYLMPFGGLFRLEHFLSDYEPFQLFSNGVVFRDQDNNATDNVIGKFSVGGVNWEARFGSNSVADFQEAANEPTAYEITSGDWGFDPVVDPTSFLSFIAAPHFIPEIELINEPFSGSATGGTGITAATPQGYIYSTPAGNNFGGAGHPNGTSGWTKDGSGNLRCSILASSELPGGGPFGGTPHATVFFGFSEIVSGDTNDPRNYQHTLLGLEDFICETTFACDVAGEVNLMVGFQPYNGTSLPAPELLDPGCGCRLTLAGTVLTATLISIESGSITSPSFTNGIVDEFSSTSTITSSYTPGTVYRIKVERRRYRVRAKVWLDGSSEPSTWLLDAYMSFRWRRSPGGVAGFIDYPYDDNWPGNLDHDIIDDRIWFENQLSLPGIVCYPTIGISTPHQVVTISEYILTIDFAGTVPKNMTVAEEDYEGSNRSNSVVIPYASVPSARFIEGSLRKRHFLADTHGFNLLAWKDPTSPELQPAVLTMAWEKAVFAQIIALDFFFDDTDHP